MSSLKTTSEVLYNLIKDSGLTPYVVSSETGISQATLSRLLKKNAKPHLSTAKKLADFFDVDLTYILTGKHSNIIEAEIFDSRAKGARVKALNKGDNPYNNYYRDEYRIYVKKLSLKAYPIYIDALKEKKELEFINSLPEVSFTVEGVLKGHFLSFVAGDQAMNGGGINDAPQNAELLCMLLDMDNYLQISYNKPYGFIVVHKDTIIYCDIKDSLDGTLTVGYRSGLPQHRDFKIPLLDVVQIWQVIKRSF